MPRLHALTEVKLLSPSSTRLLDVLLRITPSVYFLPCRGSPHEVSFSRTEPGMNQKGGVNEVKARELFCYRTQCNDAIYN